LRLWQDLDLSAAGTALVLDLLDQIEDLRSRLRRAGIR
jgi:chaperone modulatory protein CbpM